MPKTIKIVCAVVFMAILANRASWAGKLIYDAGQPVWGVTIAGKDTPLRGNTPSYWAAQRFYLPQNTWVDKISVSLATGSDPNHAGYRVSLVTNILDAPNSTLASWTVHPVGLSKSYIDQTITPVRVSAYQEYALVITPGDGMVYGSMWMALNGLYPALYSTTEGASWYGQSGVGGYPAAMRVYGTVPEPSSLFGLLIGVVPLIKRRLRS